MTPQSLSRFETGLRLALNLCLIAFGLWVTFFNHSATAIHLCVTIEVTLCAVWLCIRGIQVRRSSTTRTLR